MIQLNRRPHSARKYAPGETDHTTVRPERREEMVQAWHWRQAERWDREGNGATQEKGGMSWRGGVLRSDGARTGVRDRQAEWGMAYRGSKVEGSA